jgi:hypothetical protein
LPAYRSSAAGSVIADIGFGVRLNDNGSADADNKISSDNYYTSEGKYDLVPIQYQNIDPQSIASYDLLAEAPYQSAQRRGQFAYSRFMDISNQNSLYVTESLLSSGTISLNSFEYSLGYAEFQANVTDITLIQPTGNGNSVNFIWTGTFGKSGVTGSANLSAEFSKDKIDVCAPGTITTAIYNNGLFLHKDHPDLENLYLDAQEAVASPGAVTDAEQKSNIKAIVDNAIYTMPIPATYATGTSFLYSGIQSLVGTSFSTSAVNSVLAAKQLAFQKTSSLITLGDRTFKMSFDANDQYLLGGRSCGAFLFLSPINLNTLSVEGDSKQSKKEIKGRVAAIDSSNALSVDIIFQYRMTDYYGNDAASDIGRVGGQAKLNFPNLTYTKKIGLDIFDKYDQQFSFDLEVFAKYSPFGKNLNSIKAAKLTRYGSV